MPYKPNNNINQQRHGGKQRSQISNKEDTFQQTSFIEKQSRDLNSKSPIHDNILIQDRSLK